MHNQKQHAQQLKDDWTSSVHQFLQEGKSGGLNDNDPGLYIHGPGGTIKMGEDDSLRNPVDSGHKGVRDMSPQQQIEFQKMYDEYHQPRGVYAQKGPELMGAYASSIVA